MSKKLPVNGFMWYDDYLSDFNEDFIKNYSEDGEKRYFLEVDIEYPEELWSSHKDLPFLAERRKLEKVEKLIAISFLFPFFIYDRYDSCSRTPMMPSFLHES